jgi:hypothetical protein
VLQRILMNSIKPASLASNSVCGRRSRKSSYRSQTRHVLATSLSQYSAILTNVAVAVELLHISAANAVRLGYRRLHVLVRREGAAMNHKSLAVSIARSDCRSVAEAGANGRWAAGRQ